MGSAHSKDGVQDQAILPCLAGDVMQPELGMIALEEAWNRTRDEMMVKGKGDMAILCLWDHRKRGCWCWRW